MNLKGIKIKVHDMSLRDGMHPKRHQITIEQMKSIAKGLDESGVPLIEVTHGDGLGGASVNYGFPAASDEEYLRQLGLLGIEMSTLYRTLRQLEKNGLLNSTWEPGPAGPARRVYTVTDIGNVWLDNWATALSAYRGMIDRFFGLYTRRGPTAPE